LLVELFPYPLKQSFLCLDAFLLLVGLPGVLLRLLKPIGEVWWVEGQLAVVLVCCLVFVEPAVVAEVVADLLVELDFVMECQCSSAPDPEGHENRL
jgi:hypothetical protein